MALIGTILLWLLWILLGLLGLILAVLLLALLLPVRVWLRYDAAGFAVRLQVLFFRWNLLPKKKDPAKEKSSAAAPEREAPALEEEPLPQDTAPPKREPEKPGSAKTNSPQLEKSKKEKASAQAAAAHKRPAKKQPDPRVRRILESLPAVLDMAGTFLGAVLRSLRFTRLEAVVPVSGGAPDAVARKVGKANAWFYAIAAPLENVLHLKWKQVRIFPDYKEEYPDSLLLAGCIRGQLLPVVIAVLHLLIRLKKENIL
jgi:hypothetical protein